MKSATRLAPILVAGLATFAHAGQHFSFSDPIPTGSYANSMFETSVSGPIGSIQNFYTGTVMLNVDSFSSTAGYLGSDSRTARYFLSSSSASLNDKLQGQANSPGVFATGGGQMIFTSTDLSTVYLRVAFTSSVLSSGGFLAAQGLTFSGDGNFFHPIDTTNPNASFVFPDSFTQTGSTNPVHHTASFSASLGQIGTVPVPEPAPTAALSFGLLALLRRRRR